MSISYFGNRKYICIWIVSFCLYIIFENIPYFKDIPSNIEERSFPRGIFLTFPEAVQDI